jgi:pyrroloquinoline quinone (PQQ) biosynthesis protein C
MRQDVEMTKSPEQFKEALLDVCQKRWLPATYLEEFNRNNLSREGARVYALEHSVFAANFPRWLGNIVGNCPHLEVRQYLIENMFVEEVRDPTVGTAHYESLVDFAVALGLDRQFVYDYKGADITRWRMGYCEWASKRSWLEGFAAITASEVSRGKEMIARIGNRAKSSRKLWDPLKLSDKELAHWDSAEEADSHEGGHGDMPVTILQKYATTKEQQDACLAAAEELIDVYCMWADQIGVWAFEAAGLKPPSLDGRRRGPVMRLANERKTA